MCRERVKMMRRRNDEVDDDEADDDEADDDEES